MGKRRLHNNTYYTCDWTGMPMPASYCYMPTWNDKAKLVKHGSYCNWESVVAHAIELGDNIDAVREYVNTTVGTTVEPAPHYTKLQWFEANMRHVLGEEVIASHHQFQEECNKLSNKCVWAVRIQANGMTDDILLEDAKFEAYLQRPYSVPPGSTAQSFKTTRKYTAKKDKDLTVYYWPHKNGLPFNQTASNQLKMQIYGDVVLVLQTKEACFLPRERFINYSLQDYHEHFTTKKRKENTGALTEKAYAALKDEMTTNLQAAEAQVSSSACEPSELAQASVLPPASGKELADLMVQKGHKKPRKTVAESAGVPDAQ